MKKLKTIFPLLLLLFMSPAQAAKDDPVIKARSASKELLTTLKAQLESALKSGGPEPAITTCSVIAPHIAGNVSKKHGLKIKRVSLKNRNPNGEPDDFDKDALKNFDFLNRKNKLKPSHEYFAVVKENNKNFFRYLKPVVTGKMCLQCHGQPENIKPEVLTILNEKYPGDTATGYNEGDIRGAVSVKLEVK